VALIEGSGEVVAAMSKLIYAASPKVAEAIGLRFPLEVMLQRKFLLVVIEGEPVCRKL
jgi:hypothetical protein